MKRGFTLILILISTMVFSQERFRSGIFLHHSTGDYIWGNEQTENTTTIPDEINKYNTNNGYEGDEECTMNEKWWPNSTDNDWYYWYKIFSNDTTDNIFSIIDENKIVIIKSCYPSSDVISWGEPSDTNNLKVQTVYNYKYLWRRIVDVMKKYPNNFFVIWTNAQSVNDYDSLAYNSHLFCAWAKDTLAKGLDTEYGEFPKNIYVFDYFHKIVGDNYKMKIEFAQSDNVHPNGVATDLIAPQFVEEIFDAAIGYENYYNNGGLQPPVLINPENNSSELSPDVTLKWESSWGADSYNVQVSTQTDFGTTVINETINETTYYAGDDLKVNTTYYWRVKSLDNGEESDDWSEVWTFTTATATALNHKTKESKFEIYPNPSRGNINIKTNGILGDLRIKVYNIIGQLVKDLEVHINRNDVFSVDLGSLPQGQYFIDLKTENEVSTKKIIII